ncbi:DUF4232 domain-containing protein [Streptomyces liangshanensis]|uniref:DUF4232 domain-containing protein n=1 Tax=Streptomyces liangshanensis TaxID=2717324 RepID=A0A6G9H002_9ACTN|nr:DUF4232 domain-containing protein [Streptomyces liangshanensis]QIQ03646.1 DUF4232 domain-containing protein [Streptomyces liangshanensis]
MSSIRTSRTLHTPRTRLLTAAATVALAALSLTACSDGTGTRDEGASATPRSASTPTISATSSTPATDSGSDASSTGDAKPADPAAKRTAVQASTAKAPAAAAKAVTCEGSVTKTVAAPLNRPVNHMLLTVTNTGSKICYLYGYPAVRFGEAQSVPPVIEDSQPQAVVTLEPGQSGYASISLSATDGSGTHGRTEKSLAVYFQGRSGNGSVGKGATPRLPAKGTYIDDSLQVTYWQQSMDDAISW